MSDPLITPEAKTLITGEAPIDEKKIILKSADGSSYEPCALSLRDLIDFEEETGMSLLFAAENKLLKAQHLVEVAYLSARRSGQTKVQIINGEYRISRDAFLESFGFDFFAKGGSEYSLQVLRLCGVLKKKDPTKAVNPTEEQGKSAGTKDTVVTGQ
jgi:hypothetical protein